MLDAGRNLEHLRPLGPDGTAFEGAIGCHRGNSEDLNVSNPLPGFLYYWGLNTQSSLMKLFRIGFEVVPSDSPERAFSREPDFRSLGLDGIQTNKDVVLLRIPEERYRVHAEREALKAKTAREGPTQEFLNKNSDYDRWAQTADGPILYASRTHKVLGD
jgi:hypothetical protein